MSGAEILPDPEHDEPIMRAIARAYASLLRRGYKSGLDAETRTPHVGAELLRRLGLTRPECPILSIAGSKGKGSSTYFAAIALVATGREPTWITSPQMVLIEERIRSGLKEIDEATFVQHMEAIWPVIREIDAAYAPEGYVGPSAIFLAVALRWRPRPEAMVLEMGRGAAHDEMRLVEPSLGILTPVFGEHREQLGNTLAEIAREKAAVWPTGGSGVSAVQTPAVAAELRSIAGEKRVNVAWEGTDFARVSTRALGQQSVMEFRLPSGQTYVLELPSIRWHLGDNAAPVLAALELLDLLPEPEELATLIRSTTWPARMDVIETDRRFLVDCTVHRSSARRVVDTLAALGEPIEGAVLGIPTDKDVSGVARVVRERTGHLVLTAIERPTLHFDPARLRRLAREVGAEFVPDTEAAFDRIVASSGRRGVVLALGTISFAGWMLRRLGLTGSVVRPTGARA